MSQTNRETVRITDRQRLQAGKLSRVVQSLEKCIFELDSTIAVMTPSD